ncbi:hypothetical protein CONPUDRAFT_156542 [Coniophora puteana RWD-64-598 SS2]|uniref:F-box domain-containing protein n=1 Tax=Coniophora puteana (strain RWD-64-598) TaxID=741705 RepID=A0A5M3MIF2_CONPW|nr:uncharacterized protein CONPUDRAFT_156542 [Coniophora puteana RWD-64-598 SS2]EIW78564.1 hypothetical protein CONPUDRAFT_156542 [Coniophora puteana RWD-64-598 SS2]
MPILFNILGPSIAHITICTKFIDIAAITLLAVLGQRCPRLISFGWSSEAEFSEGLVRALANVVRPWTHLTMQLNADALRTALAMSPATVLYTFKRHFTTADWDIFFGYARRVTTLHLSTEATSTSHSEHQLLVNQRIDVSIFQVLCKPPDSRPLFPRLRQLGWYDDTAHDTLSFMRLLITGNPSIRHLTVYAEIMDVRMLSLVATLGQLFPSLSYLQWGDSLDTVLTDDIAEAFSNCVYAWGNLAHLECPTLNADALLHLSSLNSLEYLGLTIPAILPVHREPQLNMFSVVHGLSLLTHSHQSLTDVAHFLELIVASPEDIFVVAEMTVDAGVAAFMETLSRHCDHTSLHKLHIMEFYTDAPQSDRERLALGYNALRPLFSFGALTSLDIDSGRRVLLDDNGLLAIADALPKLESLGINERCGWRTCPLTTLQILPKLLSRLRDLSYLSIALDTRRQYPEGDTIKVIVENGIPEIARVTNLNFTLNLLDSRAGTNDILHVAAFLTDVFPTLEYFSVWSLDDSPLDSEDNDDEDTELQPSRWRQIEDAMDVMRDVRRQKRTGSVGSTASGSDE